MPAKNKPKSKPSSAKKKPAQKAPVKKGVSSSTRPPAPPPSERSKTERPDPQEEFLKALTERELEYTLKADGEEKKLILKKWSLRQQFSLGSTLARVMTGFVGVIGKMGAKLDEDTDEVDAQELLNNEVLILELLRIHGDSIFDLIIATISPNNFKTFQEASEFVDTLDAQTAFQLLMVIAAQNSPKEDSKKKFGDLQSQIASLA